MVLENLWDGEDSFDGEANITEEGDVERCLGEEREKDVDEEEGSGKVS